MRQSQIIGKFNIDACDDCIKQDECTAFAFAVPFREAIVTDAIDVRNRLDNALYEMTTSLTETGRTLAEEDFAVASQRFSRLALRSEFYQNVITNVIAGAVTAQAQPESYKTEVDFKYRTLEDVLIENREDLRSVHPAITEAEINAIAIDIELYNHDKICAAIRIDQRQK